MLMTHSSSLHLILETFHLVLINSNPFSTISNWMYANPLTPNPSKTVFMLIGLLSNYIKFTLLHLHSHLLGQSFLDFILDYSLSFNQQISTLTSLSNTLSSIHMQCFKPQNCSHHRHLTCPFPLQLL